MSKKIMSHRMIRRQGLRLTLLLAASLGTVAAAAGDATVGGQVFGYQDIKTGTFHSLAAVVPEATSPVTGTVEVTFNIKLVTTFPKGTLLNCNVSVVGTSVNATAGSETSYEESAADSVSISGNTATCKTMIPYSWLVTPASTTVIDSFSGSYSVGAISGTATIGTSLRSSYSSIFSSTKIPASGTTSSYTVNVTL